jgi:hypothetical protein
MVKIWADLDKQILTKEIRLKKNLQTISQREIIESKYNRYLSLIPAEGPDEKKVAGLLSEIEKTASDIAVQINEMKPRPVRNIKYSQEDKISNGARQIKESEVYRKFTVELEAEASMANLIKFIYDLESQPRFLRVEKLQLNVKGAQSNILKCHLLITQISVDRKQ